MVTENQARAEIERLLASESFRGKDSLRRLLAYLAERTWNGTAPALKEYTIGVECFSKPQSYDPQADSSVRVHSSKLRERLEHYYAREGQENPVRVTLPRRQFGLEFTVAAVPAPAPAPEPTRRRATPWMMAAALGAGGVGGWLARFAQEPGLAPEVKELWRPFLMGDAAPVLCLGTPMFLSYGNRLRARFTDLNEFPAAAEDGDARKLGELKGPVYDYTGAGEATAALIIDRLFTAARRTLELRRSNALGFDELRGRNLIILGSAKYNPQLRDLTAKMNFAAESKGIVNREPRAGEPERYGSVHADEPGRPLTEHHGLVAILPGLHGNGRVALLASSTTFGTWGAAEYVTQPAYLRELRTKTGGADFFEAVVRVRFRANVPVEIRYVTHRAIH